MLSQQNQCLKVRRFVVAFGCMHLRTFRAGELHLVNLLRRKATPQYCSVDHKIPRPDSFKIANYVLTFDSTA